jgi:hypothetical protein
MVSTLLAATDIRPLESTSEIEYLFGNLLPVSSSATFTVVWLL